jgi:hypothetical protein
MLAGSPESCDARLEAQQGQPQFIFLDEKALDLGGLFCLAKIIMNHDIQ